MPHRQVPPLQLSAAVALQLAQALPPVPQAAVDWPLVTHDGLPASVAQQPAAQVDPSQTHCPPWHRVPTAQSGFEPQVHPPLVQESARSVGQAVQLAPPLPHCDAEPFVTQVPPAQQPEGQLVALQPLHEPPAQVWPPGHGWHVAPPLPHWVLLCAVGARQVLPTQQPVGQLVPSHTQAPPWQRCPAPHAGPVPQRHCPPVQPSVSAASHATQVPPSPPHSRNVVPVRQMAPLQQPVGQVVASQTHAPPTQR